MTEQKSRHDLISHKPPNVRALVVVPIVEVRAAEEKMRSVSARCAEAVGLAHAIALDVVRCIDIKLNKITPATLIGSGWVKELAEQVNEDEINLIVVDQTLTPVQQRNLEKDINCKVIDRTALILEIFGERARTKEGVLQVELAHLNYQKGRLVRSWTHLERQRGGSGFLGGPGETQIEADRRILQDKILRIRRELETVVKTRKLHRDKRQKVPHPVVALVGYTNAGKSTLFNHLTGAKVFAKNMLFATLDPTLRHVTLPHGQKIILSDTVGFITDLPTHLIAAFRATLEEVIEADIILHVRDMSDPDHNAHAADVNKIMHDLGVDTDNRERIVEVWNKVDMLEPESHTILLDAAHSNSHIAIPISAVTGEGAQPLLDTLEQLIYGKSKRISFHLKAHQFGLMNWLYNNGQNIVCDVDEKGTMTVDVDLTQKGEAAFRKLIS